MLIELHASACSGRLAVSCANPIARDRLWSTYRHSMFLDECHEDWLDYFGIPTKKRAQRYFTKIQVRWSAKEFEELLCAAWDIENKRVLG